MHIHTLSVGLPKLEYFHDREIVTGLCKQPVSQAIFLTKTGFNGDDVADRKHHGGADKAVCAYSADWYPYWEQVLDITLPAAAFGENVCISGLKEEEIGIGDVLQLGEAQVQVSQPRQPCSTLAARYGRKDFVKLVVDAGYTGWYFRVLQEGMVEPGTALKMLERDSHHVSVAFANQIFHHDRRNRHGIERVLAVPALSSSWRQSFQELSR